MALREHWSSGPEMTGGAGRSAIAKAEREKRLAEALRANLKRRKEQSDGGAGPRETSQDPVAGPAPTDDQNRPLSPVHTDKSSSLEDSS